MSCIDLGEPDKKRLLMLAEQSIRHGVQYQRPVDVDVGQESARLREIAATFVTLYTGQQLAGCVGTLTASEALAESVVRNAFTAAFGDSRFLPITQVQLATLNIEIAVLSGLTSLEVASEQALIESLEPAVHGLVLKYENRRATFLPKVWEVLPEADKFLAHLKTKAGLAADFWSPDLRFSLYTTDSFGNFPA